MDYKEKLLMKKRFYFLVTFFLLFYITGCTAANQQNQSETSAENKQQKAVTVSAAASLKDALNEIKTSFERENPDIKVSYNFGSSGALQQQILQGAPADLFFSAAEDKFDELVEKGLINRKSGIDLVGNQLMLVVPKDTKEIESFTDLKEHAKTIAIGTPESVPAGKYAKEMMENMGIWKDIEKKMIFAKDVRQVLTYVETGNVDAGIVYKTDALISSKVTPIATAEEGFHTPIIYPLGVINESKNQESAMIFYEFMQSDQALSIMEQYGFSNLLK